MSQPKMTAAPHRPDTEDDERWDTGELGQDEEHVRRVSSARERQLHEAIDRASDLKMISIRLQEGLIDGLKEIGKREGIPYQTLIRQVLTRYARDYEA